MIAEPILTCADCGQEVKLRCFYYRAGKDLYVAECIDLDLLSEGQTPEEAIGGLQEAVFGYLSAVFGGHEKAETKGLVPRPSPLSHRVRYHFRDLGARIRSVFDRQHEQTFPCHYTVKAGQVCCQ